MPGCWFRGVGFFHQHVIVEKLGGFGAHDTGGEFGCVRFNNEAVELGDSLPVAVIVPESAVVAVDHVFREVGAGIVVVAFDTLP